MNNEVKWRDIDYKSIVGRDVPLDAMLMFLSVALFLLALFTSLSILTSKTILLSMAGGTLALAWTALDYWNEYRRSTRKVAVTSDSIRFEGRTGSGVVLFENITRIAISGNWKGGLEVKEAAGRIVLLFPGLGRGSEFAGDLQKALFEWASKSNKRVETCEAGHRRFSRKKRIEFLLARVPEQVKRVSLDELPRFVPATVLAGVAFVMALYLAAFRLLLGDWFGSTIFLTIGFGVLAVISIRAGKPEEK